MERRSLLIFLLAIGLFFLSSISEGANWEKITKSEDGNTSVFVDTKSIRHISKTFVRAWIKILFDKPFVFNSISTTKILDCVAVDCCENKIKHLKGLFYYSDGKNETDVNYADWNDVTPDTLESVIYEYLCNKG